MGSIDLPQPCVFGNPGVTFICSFCFPLLQQKIKRIRIMDGIASKGGGTALSLEQSRVSSIESEARPAQPGQVTGAEPSVLAVLQHRSPSDEGSLSRRNPPSSWNRLQPRARTHSQQLQHCPGCGCTPPDRSSLQAEELLVGLGPGHVSAARATSPWPHPRASVRARTSEHG